MTQQVIFVRKSDRTEVFDANKIANSLLNVGLQASLAINIANEIFEEIKDAKDTSGNSETEISSKEIKANIYEKLKINDLGLANKYLKGNIPKVRTSLSTFGDFEVNKISKSLAEETNIDEVIARKIAKTVEKQIGGLNLEFVTAPLIREIVCVELLKNGLERERKLYTRLGMPVYDVTFLIEHGSKENANLQFNPETIHKLMADQISKEYSLIKVLPLDLADAHMRGEIHIHDLDYFALRPFCFSHDIRFFLKHGLKVDGVGNHTAVAGPSRKPDVAFLHAAKVLASAQVNCAGGQGFSYFNTFMAPYVSGLPYEKVKQLAQMFIYEMSMMYVARGGQTVFSSIDCDMEVPEQFKNIPAILPGGIVKENTTYSDFEDETRTLFNAFVDVYLQGDFTGKAFNFPKFEVQLYPKKIDKNEDMLLKVSQLAAKFGTPYYIINQPYMPLYACYQCCSFLMPLTDANTEDDVRDGTIRGGGLQVVTINLPQIAYESNRSENKFFEILKDRLEKAKRVHLLKREIIKKNQNLGMLPFMSQIVNEKGDKYLEVDRQSCIMGLVGMNECVKFMTDCELHEDAGWKFGLNVMSKMKGIVAEIRKETGLIFSLARTPAESCSYRLSQIDYKRFPDKFIANGEGNNSYYTNSFHIRPSANVPLWKRLNVEGSFHPLTDGGAMNHVWLGEQNPDPEGILSLTKKIATKTAIQYMAFTKDLTVCSNCNFVAGGLHNNCPGCNSESVEWWSRITGYYQNIKGWNKGKLKELQDRRRYGFENSDITAKEISFTMKEGSYEAKFEKLKEKLKYDTSLDF
ncbi:MAG: anaerobic ribonucleoside-triphosphate reductase [Candidatus Altiarchaeales archaeon A3]|nr:MAG: anaerobic ribonucleoside-triphosphate reductase [Candidatus Altiarchaeales archaeon A3]